MAVQNGVLCSDQWKMEHAVGFFPSRNAGGESEQDCRELRIIIIISQPEVIR